MILRERQTDRGLLVSVCDADVLGETFEDDRVSFTVTEEFYDGEEVSAEAVVESLARAHVANIVGTEAVRVAVEAGLIDGGNVLCVDGTHHAQLVRF